MSQCANIQLLEKFDFVPSQFTDLNGYVNIDLPSGFSFSENKLITQINDLGNFQFNFVTTAQLSYTAKNKILARNLLHPNSVNRCIPVKAMITSGCATSTDNEVYIRKVQKGRIEADIIQSTNNWAKQLKNCKLKDLYGDDETFTYTCDNVNGIIQNGGIYQGNEGFTFPESFYGNSHSSIGLGYDVNIDLNSPGCSGASDGSFTIGVSDITYDNTRMCKALTQHRIWFYASDILKRSFCKIGKAFESPILDSKFGRKIITYNLRKDYGEGDEKYLLNAAAQQTLTGALGFDEKNGNAGCFSFNDVLLDNGGGFQTGILFPANRYCGVGTVKVKASYKFRIDDKQDDNDIIIIKFIKRAKDDHTRGSVYDQLIISDWKKSQEFCIDIDQTISMSEKQELCLNVWRSNTDTRVTRLPGSSITIEGCRKLWNDGDTVRIKDMMDCESSALDYIKGISELLNLKWFEDPKTCKLYALQPYEIEKLEETIPGFFDELDYIDWTDKVDDKTVCVTAPSINTPRYIQLKFRNATDLFLKGNDDYPDDLWSRLIDLGEKFTTDDKPVERVNPFFESVANNDGGGINSMMLQNESGEDNWCIGNKVAFSYGLRDSFNIDTSVFNAGNPNFPFGDSFVKTTYLDCNHEEKTQAIIAGQYIPGYLSDEGGGNDVLIGTGIECNGVLTYEINTTDSPENVQTLYHLVYAKSLFEDLLQIPIEYLVDLSCKEFNEINHRNKYLINVDGKAVFARLVEITDFKACENVTTPVKFIACKSITELCGIITPDGGSDNNGPFCFNYPILNCVKSGDNWSLSIGGSMQSTIDFVVWECRLPGGSWDILNTTAISTTILQSDFGSEPCKEVKATVHFNPFDGLECPPVTLPIKKLFNCVEVNPILNCVVSTQNNERCASVSVDAGGEIHTSDLWVDLNDGNGQTPYTAGTLLCGLLEDPIFGGFVDFENDDCDPIELLPLICELPDLEICPVLLPEVGEPVCDENNCWTITRTDSNVYTNFVGDVRIEYQCFDKATGLWDSMWFTYQSGAKPCCDGIRVRVGWFARNKCCTDLINPDIHECMAPNAGEDSETTIS